MMINFTGIYTLVYNKAVNIAFCALCRAGLHGIFTSRHEDKMCAILLRFLSREWAESRMKRTFDGILFTSIYPADYAMPV